MTGQVTLRFNLPGHYGLANEEVCTMLTTDCGWSRRRFERWLATLLQRELTGASQLE